MSYITSGILHCSALLCSHCRLFCALPCCLLLLQLYLLLKHLRSSAFSPFFTWFCHFRIFHTSLSPFFFISSCAFLYYLSFLLPDEVCGRNVVNSSVCWCSVCCSLNCYTSILFVLHKCRNFFSVAPFGAAIVVFSARVRAAFCCSTLPSVEAPMFVRFLAFLYWVLSLSYFSHFAVIYFSYFAVTFISS